MTEAEWLAATEPTPMLEFLRDTASERQLRLFMAACARLLWEKIPPGEMREAVEAAERCADGVPWEEELKGYCDRLYRLPVDARRTAGQNWFEKQSPERLGIYFTVLKTTGAGCAIVSIIPRLATSIGGPFIVPLIGARQPDLIREIFGNPFRPASLPSDCLTPPVLALAENIYQERAFDRLPILADALQDAGCNNEDVLSHCRQPCEHVRGCWVVDLLTGRK